MALNETDENTAETEENENLHEPQSAPRKPFRITMELPLLLIMMGISLSGTAIYNILLYRTCVHTLNFNKEQCKGFLLPDRTNATQDLEGAVQKYVAYVSMVRMMIEAIVPAILSLFIGVWSDTHGRKPLVVWPLLGVSVSSMFIVVYSMLDDFGPWWMIVVGIPFSLTGGFTMLVTGAYCYLSDITTEANRSLRMTLFDATIASGSMIGSIWSSHLMRAVGNVNLLLIATAFFVIAYVFTILCIKESLPGAITGGLRTVFNFRLLKEMVSGCLKRRANNARAQILLLAIVITFQVFIVYGTVNLDYLYTRQKLQWAMEDFTLYSGVSTMIGFAGAFLGVVILQRMLGVSDVVMAIGAMLFAVVDCVIKSLAVSSWQMYFASSITSVKGISGSLIRSFMSKVLPIEDTAKAFALLNVLDAVCPILAPLVYTSLYSATLNSFPGAYFLLSAAINGLSIFLLVLVQYYRWSGSGTYQPLDVST